MVQARLREPARGPGSGAQPRRARAGLPAQRRNRRGTDLRGHGPAAAAVRGRRGLPLRARGRALLAGRAAGDADAPAAGGRPRRPLRHGRLGLLAGS